MTERFLLIILSIVPLIQLIHILITTFTYSFKLLKIIQEHYPSMIITVIDLIGGFHLHQNFLKNPLLK